MDPVDALLETLRAYLRRRGAIVVTTAEAGGQERLKIAFRGLYRSLPEGLGYELFEDIIAAIESSEEARRRLEALGIRIIEYEGERYLEAPIGLLRRLWRGG